MIQDLLTKCSLSIRKLVAFLHLYGLAKVIHQHTFRRCVLFLKMGGLVKAIRIFMATSPFVEGLNFDG